MHEEAAAWPDGPPPTVGVEEEFLLVDPVTAEPVARNAAVAEAAEKSGIAVQLELTSCQVEVATSVASAPAQLHEELRRLRRTVAACAEAAGARMLAVGLPPVVPQHFPVTDTPRYQRIAERLGMIAHEQGVCGAHVHVAVPSRDHAAQVSNHLRPWLPLLLALTANSAIYRAAESGYASWRSVLWARWPSAGAPPWFDSAAEFDSRLETMLAAGAIVDRGMAYWDVRPSENFPTVEVRVSDVPATVAETVLLATLTRALAMRALSDISREVQPARVDPDLLRVAYWKSAREGLSGESFDVLDHSTLDVRTHLDRLLTHIEAPLDALGERESVPARIQEVLTRGNGAIRQLRAFRRRGDVHDVVAEVAAATMEGI